ncbi:hypothetical protein [Rhodopirellula europaea]|uniref:hypothetical protein n=1 Tax=Rhodopirellula europaea TaxID=1263866 RepID=UPI003D2673A6
MAWSASFISKKLKEHCSAPKNLRIRAAATNAFYEDESGVVGSLLKFDKRYAFNADVLDGSCRVEVIATDGQEANAGEQLFHSLLEYDGVGAKSKVYDPVDDPDMTTYGRVHRGRNGSEHLFRVGYYFLGMEDTNGHTFLPSILSLKADWELSAEEDEGHPYLSLPIFKKSTSEQVGTRVLRFSEKLDFRIVEDLRKFISAGETEPSYVRSVVFSYENNTLDGQVQLKTVSDTTRSRSVNKRYKTPTVNVFETDILEYAVGAVDAGDISITFPKDAVISDNIGGEIFVADGRGGEIPGSRRSFADNMEKVDMMPVGHRSGYSNGAILLLVNVGLAVLYFGYVLYRKRNAGL